MNSPGADRADRGPRTRAVHAAGQAPAPGTAAPASPPLYQASAQLFHSLDDLEGAYETGAGLYRRYTGPNQEDLEIAICELERPNTGAELAGIVTSSGMAALTLACLGLAAGGRVVGATDLYGGTLGLLDGEVQKLGIAGELVDTHDPGALKAAVEGAALLVVETITNPSMSVTDIAATAAVAHAAGALLLVDNTFASPALCRPLELGADIVMHSTTKYISGHSDAMGGALVLDLALARPLRTLARTLGATPGPLDSWLALRGLRTLGLRVEAASANALCLAHWLSTHAAVESVNYPGLPTDPDHELATRQFRGGFGGMLSFTLRGGGQAAAALVRHLELIHFMPSLADVATTVSHPVSTSHRGVSPEALVAAGIGPGMIRMSVGIEDADDLIADLAQAFGRL
ncbi:MAG: trans-sulfuration enzyme family protein [Candidatus Dormibacteria bacterium]